MRPVFIPTREGLDTFSNKVKLFENNKLTSKKIKPASEKSTYYKDFVFFEQTPCVLQLYEAHLGSPSINVASFTLMSSHDLA